MNLIKIISVSLWVLLLTQNFAKAQVKTTSFEEAWSAVVIAPDPSGFPAQQALDLKFYERNQFPTYPVTFERFLKKTSSGVVDLLEKAVHRTLNTHQDIYPVFDKLLHSNGICFRGEWMIHERSPWTGLYAPQTKIPVIVRASTTLGGVRRNEKRGFSMALKFFPTRLKDNPVLTQNIFLIDTLAGRQMDSIFESTVSNQPDFGVSFDFALGLHVIKTFALADLDPSFRPIDHLAAIDALGQGVGRAFSPQGLKLVPNQKVIGVVADDFRDEMRLAAQKKKIEYQIWVSAKRPKDSDPNDWGYIGTLSLKDPQITFGCDRRLHFPHPKIRERF